MFKDQIGNIMEVYIDDMVVKSKNAQDHAKHFEIAFQILEKYAMKLNPAKYHFGVSAGQFQGYMDLRLYISSPPLLAKPEKGEPLSVYLSVTDTAVSAVLMKEQEGQQHLVYYVINSLLDAEMSPNLESDLTKEANQLENKGSDQEWTLFTDGASNTRGIGLGLVLKLPKGDIIAQAVSSEFKATNNEAEYEAFIEGLKINRIYTAKDNKMNLYLEYAKKLCAKFQSFDIDQIPRDLNTQDDALASLGSNFTATIFNKVHIVHLLEPTISKPEQVNPVNIDNDSWTKPYYDWFLRGILPQDRHEARAFRIRASTYSIINNTLFKRSQVGPYLRCLEPHEARQVI
ncbi:uncharacterized protein LOC141630130 [Silene latifolia]|uniref:uncharacterized protein LOC141630130 n=1 Tax=Silene latifolia TaxID=37657 RepID=UPI003D76E883